MGRVSEPQDVSSSAQGTHYEISTETHHALSAWFIGPKAENSNLVKKYFSDIVDRIGKERHDYYPADPEFITSAAQASESYLREVKDTERYLTFITDLMSRYSLPYFSPRYLGHMCFDNSVPATLGYLAAMLHNSNNVAVEASPLTSYVEHCVGQQLCKMLGYRTTEDTKDGSYKGWGHVTCDGSIANLESMW
ncbi:uncharacterized protein LAESUDRAFT_60396 [Laetiporus sulphureus 93-53]|uniref:Uncharacterized protein n=1 Tax=Laetiporus sulphureus 93-53 TaxID=1314785 RepID=A0A165AX88_9APHY|nr:uncharacterized protein LAESUDRAFT_60396 [Laetiporus sulphureus 93-53]KZS99829.1 hypothetical protein LAESUDRAFT_60396 [Laetiporus sulphureus 93-53]